MHPLRKAAIGLRWLLTRGGPAASGQSHVGAFLKLRPESAHPGCRDSLLGGDIRRLGGAARALRLPDGNRPHAADQPGRIAAALRRRRGSPPPLLQLLRDGRGPARHAQSACTSHSKIAEHPAFARFRSWEIDPGPGMSAPMKEIHAWVRKTATTSWHPVGTCAMGDPDAAHTVVDPETQGERRHQSAGRRCVHHAEHGEQQSQRGSDDDGRTCLGPHPRPAASRAGGRGVLRRGVQVGCTVEPDIDHGGRSVTEAIALSVG